MTSQKKATIVASLTSAILIIIKLIIGVLSGSVAVLASAIDSVLDLIISIFNFFAVSKSELPADNKFNYGRGKIEALAAVIEGTVITISGIYIFYASIKKFINKQDTELLNISIIAMAVSLIITICLVIYLGIVARKTQSLVIKSDLLHYKTDIYSNLAILLGLVLVNLTGYEIIDSIVGAAIAIYIIYSAYSLIKEGIYILLDGALDDEMVLDIEKIIQSETKTTGYHDLRTRRSGNINCVDVDIVFTPEFLLLDAHHICDDIENKIKQLDFKNEWLINIHLDPLDDS